MVNNVFNEDGENVYQLKPFISPDLFSPIPTKSAQQVNAATGLMERDIDLASREIISEYGDEVVTAASIITAEFPPASIAIYVVGNALVRSVSDEENTIDVIVRDTAVGGLSFFIGGVGGPIIKPKLNNFPDPLIKGVGGYISGGIADKMIAPVREDKND